MTPPGETRSRAERDRAEPGDAVGEIEGDVEGVPVAREPREQTEAPADGARDGRVEDAGVLGDRQHLLPVAGAKIDAAFGKALRVDRKRAVSAEATEYGL